MVEVKEFDTLIGRVSQDASDIAVVYDLFGDYFFPKYFRELTVKRERPRYYFLVEEPELESLEDALSNDKPWDVLSPMPIVEQALQSIQVEGYKEALDALLGKDSFDPRVLLIEWLEKQEDTQIWRLPGIDKVYQKEDLSKSEINSIVSEAYSILRSYGARNNIKEGLRGILNRNQVGNKTLEFLTKNIDNRFSDTGPSEDKEYVLFMQRAVAKALVCIGNPESFSDMDYKGKLVSEESIFESVLKGGFLRIDSNYGASSFGEKKNGQLRPIKAMSFKDFDSIPENIKADYKPINKIVDDVLVMTQIAYNSILKYAEQKYKTYGKERIKNIAAETARKAMPFNFYFTQLFGSNGDAKNTDEVDEMWDDILKQKAKVAEQYQSDASIAAACVTVGELAENLPKDLLDLMSGRYYKNTQLMSLDIMSKKKKMQRDMPRIRLEGDLAKLEDSLKDDFGLDPKQIPTYQRKFGRSVVTAAVQTYLNVGK